MSELKATKLDIAAIIGLILMTFSPVIIGVAIVINHFFFNGSLIR